MKTPKIAICDDEANALDIIDGSVRKVFSSYHIDIAPDRFKSAEELLKAMRDSRYDLVFLDINMPKMDGIALGKRISAMEDKPLIIFISSNSNRVFETFSIRPFGFVRKQDFFSDISGAIGRYVAEMQKTEEPDLQFELKQRGSYLSVNATALKYIECFKNMQILHIADGENKTVYSRMSVFENILATHDFIRVHKGYIVSCRYIRRFERCSVILKTGEELPVGRSKHDAALAAYLEYIRKNGITIIG